MSGAGTSRKGNLSPSATCLARDVIQPSPGKHAYKGFDRARNTKSGCPLVHSRPASLIKLLASRVVVRVPWLVKWPVTAEIILRWLHRVRSCEGIPYSRNELSFLVCCCAASAAIKKYPEDTVRLLSIEKVLVLIARLDSGCCREVGGDVGFAQIRPSHVRTHHRHDRLFAFHVITPGCYLLQLSQHLVR